MTQKFIHSSLEWVLAGVGVCLVLPIYGCFYLGHSITREREKEKKRRKAVVKGLPLGKKRRKLSISSVIDETNQEPESKDDSQPPPKSLKSSFFSRFSSHQSWVKYTHSQEQCLFLTALPYELRLLIYEHVMGFDRVHLVHINGRIQGLPCRWAAAERSCHCLKDGVKYPYARNGCVVSSDLLAPVTLSGAKDSQITGVITLLQTCRIIYTEFISVLYNRVFEMRPFALMALSVSIPPHRFSSISKLELDELNIDFLDTKRYQYYLPSFCERRQQHPTEPGSEASRYGSRAIPMPQISDSERITVKTALDDPHLDRRERTAWDVTCFEVLPQMIGLKELRVRLYCETPDHLVSLGRERTILRPLFEVRLPNLRVFEVQVNWRAGYRDAWEGGILHEYERSISSPNMPFKLVRV